MADGGDSMLGSSILPLLPPTAQAAEDYDFDQIDCVPTGPEVNVVDDYELAVNSSLGGGGNGLPVVELMGTKSKISFFTNTDLPHLVMHIKTMSRFVIISISLRDEQGKQRVLEMSNAKSTVIVDKSVCSLPLELGEGWQYLNIDLERLVFNAFGTHFAQCSEITVHGSCRLSKLFFQRQEYSDVELPPFLRVVGKE